MTSDEILAKVTSGELSGEQLTTTVSGLDPAVQLELKSKLAAETTKTLGEMSAIRKEKQRVEDLIKEKQDELAKFTPPAPATPPPGASDETLTQFRKEQKQKALTKFKGDFGLSDDEEKAIATEFEKFDSGAIDAELIYNDLVGTYAFVNSDKLVQADQERQRRAAAAAAHAAGAAGGAANLPPNNNNEPPKYSPEVTALAKQANISEEAAKKQLEQGTKRVYQ